MAVSVGSIGFIGENAAEARGFWFQHWHAAMEEVGKIRGFRAPGWEDFEAQATGKGALLVGAPEDRALE